MATVIIDGTEINAKEGDNLLWTALDNGFYIPNLCALRGFTPPTASCRLCFVQIEGKQAPVTSCTESIKDGMIVHLNTPEVKKIRNTAFRLLLSNHTIDCIHCDKNKNCELQNIASNLGLKLKHDNLRKIARDFPIDSSHPLFYYDPNKCVLCGRCIRVCHRNGTGILDFAFRGISTMVSTFNGVSLAESDCNSCLKCVEVCPVGSLVVKLKTGKEKSDPATVK
jgi:formate dehydrogenase major subunit/NADH-quinone oxidoreductase subunit G